MHRKAGKPRGKLTPKQNPEGWDVETRGKGATESGQKAAVMVQPKWTTEDGPSVRATGAESLART